MTVQVHLLCARLPQSQQVLHAEADGGDGYPAAEAHEDGLAAGLDEVDDVGVQADGGHGQYDEKLRERLERFENVRIHTSGGGDGGDDGG